MSRNPTQSPSATSEDDALAAVATLRADDQSVFDSATALASVIAAEQLRYLGPPLFKLDDDGQAVYAETDG